MAYTSNGPRTPTHLVSGDDLRRVPPVLQAEPFAPRMRSRLSSLTPTSTNSTFFALEGNSTDERRDQVERLREQAGHHHRPPQVEADPPGDGPGPRRAAPGHAA